MKTTISATLVAWSPIRSMYLAVDCRRVASKTDSGSPFTQASRSESKSRYSAIEMFVGGPYLGRQLKILLGEGAQRPVGHLAGVVHHRNQPGHQRGLLPGRGRIPQLHHPLADVFRQVSYPLQVGDQLQRGHDETQVVRHRLSQGQHLHAQRVHGQLVSVDLLIGGDHLAGQDQVAFGKRSRGSAQDVLQLPAHLGHQERDPLQIGLVFAVGVFHHIDLPVSVLPGPPSARGLGSARERVHGAQGGQERLPRRWSGALGPHVPPGQRSGAAQFHVQTHVILITA